MSDPGGGKRDRGKSSALVRRAESGIDAQAAFGFVKANQATYPVRRMCGLLGVSPSGHYAWLNRIPSVKELADRALRDRITDIHSRSRGAYATPRIHAELATRVCRWVVSGWHA
ncbi:MAG: hypothetical protein F4X74_05820 [Acidimicrobiia bacterium]|nr:hypothetical protein [Acidimicrobiia bacterium]